MELDRELYPDFSTGGPVPEVIDPDEIYVSDTDSECSFILDNDGRPKQKKECSKSALSLNQTTNDAQTTGNKCSTLHIYPTRYKTFQNMPLRVTGDLGAGIMTNPTALFTWFHMEVDTMDFDRFKHFIDQRLGREKSRNLNKLFENLESHIHSSSTWGGKETHMDPCFRYYARSGTQKFPGGPRAKNLWLCFPYLTPHLKAANKTRSWDPSSVELRVEFPLKASPDSEYFGFSRFWCLITEDRMFTCARVPMRVLLEPGGPIRLAPSCFDSSGHRKTEDETPQSYLHVLDAGNRMYLLEAQRCRSWLAFKLQLDDAMSQTQSNRWWLFYDDNEVCAEDWRSLNLAEKAKTEQVFLVIKYPEVKEPLDLTHTIGNEARHVFYSEHGSSSTGSLRSRAEPQDNTQEMREVSTPPPSPPPPPPPPPPRTRKAGPSRRTRQASPPPRATESSPPPRARQTIPPPRARELSPPPRAKPALYLDSESPLKERSEDQLLTLQSLAIGSMAGDESDRNSTKLAEARQEKPLTEQKSDPEANQNSHTGRSPEDALEKSSHGKEEQRPENSLSEDEIPAPEAEDLLGDFQTRTQSTAAHLVDVSELDWKTELQTFRVFTWMCATPVQTESTEDEENGQECGESSKSCNDGNLIESIAVDQQKLSRCLQAAHDHLSTKEPYMSCQERDLEQTAWIEDGGYFEVARDIFELFLPLGHRSAVAEKYWGGFRRIHTDPMIVDPQARTLLYGCARQSRGLLQEFSNEYGPSATELAVPSSLYNAFLTITCFMTSSIGHGRESDSAGRDLLRKFQRQLKQGREVMMRSIDPDPVSVKEAILPAGILASVLEWLLEFAPVDVSYMDMMYELERRAHRRAENEKDEELLWLLMQDIAKISGMTRDQEDLLLRLHNCLSTPATKTDKEAPFSDGKQSAMIFHLIKTASFKLGDFRMLAEKRGYIENMHNRNYLAKKDDREAASLTFAIVSVIFLPLTTVASILGMNTREVRDMQYTQWVFWATGIPLAILTGMFCLWCTSRLNKFKQWFRSHLLPRSKSGNRKLARPERETDPKIIGTDNGPDSNGEQICTVRRRWKRLKNREDQANNQV